MQKSHQTETKVYLIILKVFSVKGASKDLSALKMIICLHWNRLERS